MNKQLATASEPTAEETPVTTHTVITRCYGQFPIPQPAVRIDEVTDAPMTTTEAKRKAREEFRAKRRAYMKEYHKHYVRPSVRAKMAAEAKEAE